MPEALLRAPSADDRDAVRALCAVALGGEDDPGGIADLLVGGAGGSRRAAVGAFLDGRLVGVAAAGGRTRADAVITGHLDLIAVHPAHRRAGVWAGSGRACRAVGCRHRGGGPVVGERRADLRMARC
ncbi:MAG: hypothetical protein DLM58_11405 [Pseudonocardiales bacterium]|nr:MAG: hypothetical protein DLM58_11405 [Pseudonocardiales bacterium]